MSRFTKALEGLSPSEKKTILKGLRGQGKVRTFTHSLGDSHFKFGYCSDTHIGHKRFSYELFDRMCTMFKQEGIDTVYHAGDVVEGMSGRQGHVYELEHIGASAQVSAAVKLFSAAPFTTYAIAGNHDLWYMAKSDIGLRVGDCIANQCANFVMLGDWEADVLVAKNVRLKLFHGNDGTAYADSYKLQKLIESFTGGEKPNIVLSGHYHKAVALFRRNVFGFECGTLCGQTSWMRGKKIQAHMGFGIIEAWADKKGITRLRHEFFPFYEKR